MSRDNAIQGKLLELASKIEREDPRAARVLQTLATEMYANCTSELNRLAERFLRRMLAAGSLTTTTV
jgi:hypothetical protein